MVGISRWFARNALYASTLVLLMPARLAYSAPMTVAGNVAQAKSQVEFDAYLEIVRETNPREVVRRVDAFVAQFPQSDLLGAAYQHQVAAFQKLDNFDGMLSAGRKALARDPNSLDTLLQLAPAMASRSHGRADGKELLEESQELADRALKLSETVHVPRKTSLEQWRAHKRQLQSEAHGVLGLVAFQRADLANAVGEFQTSIQLAANPTGVQYLRLGLALSASKKKDEARRSLLRADELGPDEVSQVAKAELSKLAESRR
jgi:tetratricopeptide (TPR) repeat protein